MGGLPTRTLNLECPVFDSHFTYTHPAPEHACNELHSTLWQFINLFTAQSVSIVFAWVSDWSRSSHIIVNVLNMECRRDDSINIGYTNFPFGDEFQVCFGLLFAMDPVQRATGPEQHAMTAHDWRWIIHSHNVHQITTIINESHASERCTTVEARNMSASRVSDPIHSSPVLLYFIFPFSLRSLFDSKHTNASKLSPHTYFLSLDEKLCEERSRNRQLSIPCSTPPP